MTLQHFTTLGSDLFSTEITYAAWVLDDYNDFTLNALGRAAIDVVGISKFGTGEGKYDLGAATPGWRATNASKIQGWCAEKGEGFKPKLVVTYHPKPVGGGGFTDLVAAGVI